MSKIKISIVVSAIVILIISTSIFYFDPNRGDKDLEFLIPQNTEYIAYGSQSPYCENNVNCSWSILLISSEKMNYVVKKYDGLTGNVVSTKIKTWINDGGITGPKQYWEKIWGFTNENWFDSLPLKNNTKSCVIVPNENCNLYLYTKDSKPLRWLEISDGNSTKKIEYVEKNLEINDDGFYFSWIDSEENIHSITLENREAYYQLVEFDEEIYFIELQISGATQEKPLE